MIMIWWAMLGFILGAVTDGSPLTMFILAIVCLLLTNKER